jgi:hypothetical protein
MDQIIICKGMNGPAAIPSGQLFQLDTEGSHGSNSGIVQILCLGLQSTSRIVTDFHRSPRLVSIQNQETASANLFIFGWALAGQFSEAGNQGDLRAFLDGISRQFRGFNVIFVLSKGHQPKGLHDPGKINPSWASDVAAVARGTYPAGIQLFYLFADAQLSHVNDLAGEGIHMFSHGARTPAGSALKALMYLLATQFFQFRKEVFINCLC